MAENGGGRVCVLIYLSGKIAFSGGYGESEIKFIDNHRSSFECHGLCRYSSRNRKQRPI
jgi:hypothetical protein